MRFVSLSLLLAVGMAGISGCGGAGTTSPTQPVLDDPYDNPPSTLDPVTSSDATPAPYDTPPVDYQSPSGENPCPRLCPIVTELSCLAEGQEIPLSEAQCEAQCTANLSDVLAEPCLDEVIALFACLFDDSEGLTCDLLSQAQEGQLGDDGLAALGQRMDSCGDEIAANDRCSAAQPPPMDDGGGRCMPNRCNNCPDDCAQCACDQDAAACAACDTPPTP